jgi:hypothetical protein
MTRSDACPLLQQDTDPEDIPSFLEAKNVPDGVSISSIAMPDSNDVPSN